MKIERAIVGIGLLSVMGLPMSVEASDSNSLTLKQIGRYSAGASTVPDEPRAEIAAYDPASKRLFSINLNLRQLDVLDLSNPESQVLAPIQTRIGEILVSLSRPANQLIKIRRVRRVYRHCRTDIPR